jgi:hydrogenase maturation protein HypF
MVNVLHDLRRNEQIPVIAVRFHNMLVEAAVRVAERIGKERVVLSGGCFQNRYLTERLIARLRQEGFRPYWHQRVPPNDGGIALGQIYAALLERRVRERSAQCVEMLDGRSDPIG